MRSAIIPALAAFASLVTASPIVQKRQDIDFAAYNAIPTIADAAAPAGDVAPAAITYAATEVAQAAASAIVDATSDSGAAAAVTRRDAEFDLEKRNACDTRTVGTGPSVNSPDDTAASFQAYQPFSDAANGATDPVGYSRVVTNSLAAAQDSTYMTYTMLSSYDTAACAAFCQAHQGCNSFNLFYERDATVEPGPGCENPPSLTYIKCSIFGGILTSKSAKNDGQWQSQFHVVIAGSDIYVATAPVNPSGFVGPYNYNNAAINAPSGYMGVQTFPQTQPYDPSVCAAACDKKSAYDIKYGLPSKANPDVCNFFVAYILYKNGQNGVFTCTYYTSLWDTKYATNKGQYDSAGNHYTIGYSNGFSKVDAPKNGVFSSSAASSSTSSSVSSTTSSQTTTTSSQTSTSSTTSSSASTSSSVSSSSSSSLTTTTTSITTISATPSPTSFQLKIVGGSYDSFYVGLRDTTAQGYGFSPSPSRTAATFTIDPTTGYLTSGALSFGCEKFTSFYCGVSPFGTTRNLAQMTCSDVDGYLSCQSYEIMTTFRVIGAWLYLYDPAQARSGAEYGGGLTKLQIIYQ